MKILLMTFVFTMLLIGTAIAQTPAEKDVAQALENMRLAMISGNKADLDKVGLPNMVYVHTSGRVETGAQYVDNIVTKGTEFKELTFSDVQIAIDGDVAIVRHIFEADLFSKGKPGTTKIGVMATFKKANGEWKLFGRQAYKLPS